ncbi:MAG: pyruvate carboxylase subunit B [Terriglobales bacterium]|jgi:methylmalonyl-CoA carboxyltransferase 5S subunit
MARTVEITELLREAQQSLLETSMALEDFVPVCEDLDNAGYWSVECWGGMAFHSCIRFLNEDPWERLRTYRKLLPKSRLQMLLRGQSLVDHRNFDDSIVRRFVEKAALNGIDVFRTFDALNDVRNLKTSVEAVKKAGKHAQGALCYAPSPVHTIPVFVDIARQIKEIGCDSICVQDVDGLLKPQAAYDLVKGIKQKCGSDTLVSVHTHSTTGVTMVSLMKAIEAGCDIVDTAISSLALGRGHNPTESVVAMLDGTGYESRLDMERLNRIKRHIANVRPRYGEFFNQPIGVETETFQHQIPASLILNMAYLMKSQGTPHLLDKVIAEIQSVRRDAGYPALARPASEILGTQAMFNVLQGKYKVITSEFADLMLGYYGTTLGEKNPEVVAQAAIRANKPAITCRPADLLEPSWEQRRTEVLAAGCNGSDEDVLTYAMFPKTAAQFFQTRTAGPKSKGEESSATKAAPGPAPAESSSGSARPGGSRTYIVRVSGEEHKVTVTPAQ